MVNENTGRYSMWICKECGEIVILVEKKKEITSYYLNKYKEKVEQKKIESHFIDIYYKCENCKKTSSNLEDIAIWKE